LHNLRWTGASASKEDESRRAEYLDRLRQYLQEPGVRSIEGFPIGEDEDILALSDPPYYTASPNPFLPEILERWQVERTALRQELGLPNDSHDNGNGAEPVDHREPFASDVSEGKNHPIYNAHSYHIKTPHKAIMRYILHCTDPGDIVFDGFCGTGMTGVVAQLCGDKRAVQDLGYHVDDDGLIYDSPPFTERVEDAAKLGCGGEVDQRGQARFGDSEVCEEPTRFAGPRYADSVDAQVPPATPTPCPLWPSLPRTWCTFDARVAISKGLLMKLTVGSSTPWLAMVSSV